MPDIDSFVDSYKYLNTGGRMLNVIVRYEENLAGVGIWILDQNAQGQRVCANPVKLVFTPLPVNWHLPDPTFTFDQGDQGKQFLQELSNALTHYGFLPDLAKLNEVELAAVKYHLEDMRTLVFKDR